MPEYKTIKGVKYDKPLLEAADKLVAGMGDGRISFDDAKELWAVAFEDGKVTVVERRTILYIFDNYKWTDKAKGFMEGKLFKVIDGVSYDLVLLNTADKFTEGQGDGRVSYDDACVIWELADADGVITEVESRTITYICNNYNCTDKAQKFLEEKLANASSGH
ncbi:MAG: hypothetical protein AAF570_17550 [Bacteroidota bacterium]